MTDEELREVLAEEMGLDLNAAPRRLDPYNIGIALETCFSAMRRVAAQVRAETVEWQPIETAPKDREILAGYHNRTGKWVTIRAQYFSRGTLSCDECAFDDPGDEYGYMQEDWYEFGSEHEALVYSPDHILEKWMPLPDPPRALLNKENAE